MYHLHKKRCVQYSTRDKSKYFFTDSLRVKVGEIKREKELYILHITGII